MKTAFHTLALAASLLASWSTAAALSPQAEPVFQAGSQFTATLDQTRNQWRLQPLSGPDVLIDTGSCATGAMVPAGVWLLVRDRLGRPELLAPSVTPLPAGSPERIALRACSDAEGRQLAVPQSVLDLLAATSGAIYVSP